MNKKKKHHTIIYYITVYALISFFTAVSLSVIAAQTHWGREKIRTALINFAKKNNINLKIESINGLIPFEYKFKNLSIASPDQQIDIEKLQCSIKLLPLSRNKLSFRSFAAENIFIESKSTANSSEKKPVWISSPIDIEFDRLKLSNLLFKTKKPFMPLNVHGKAKIKKDGKTITCAVVIKRPDFNGSYLDLSLKAVKENRLINLKAYLNIDTIKALDFIIKKEAFDLSFDMHFETRGSLDDYLNISRKSNKSDPKIRGYAFGKIFNYRTRTALYNFLTDKETRYSFELSTLDNLNVVISKGLLKNELFTANLDTVLTQKLTLEKLDLNLKIPDLSKIKSSLPVFGSFNALASYDKDLLNLNCSFENFKIKNAAFIDFRAAVLGQRQNNTLSGSITSSFFALDQPFNLSSNYKFEKLFLDLWDLKINSPSSTLSANLSLTPALFLIGDGKIHFGDLKQIQILYPEFIFCGITDVNFYFKQKTLEEQTVQNLLIDITARDYLFKSSFGKLLNISLNIDDPFLKPSIDCEIKINDLKYSELNINKLLFTASAKEENWPYKIHLEGKLKKPFNIDSGGFFRIDKKEFLLNIQDLSGFLFTHNFISPSPIKIEASEKGFLLTDLSLELPDSSIYADINLTKKASHAKIALKHFPLDFLSINPLDLDVSGFASLNLNLDGFSDDIAGSIDLDLEEINILTLGEKAPLQASGKIKSQIKNKYFNFNGFLNLKETQFFSLNGNIPLDIDMVKFKFMPDNARSASANLKYNGKIEEILDFLNIGPQRLEGEINSQIELSNKINNLEIKGFCALTNGYYENYYTGTVIKELKANIIGSNEKILLEYLNGKDPEKGEVFAEGMFSISKDRNFPFYFKTQAKNLLCVDSSVFKAAATADLEISGDRFSSTAKGNVLIDKLDMSIPDKLPVVIPDLKPLFTYHPYQKEPNKESSEPSVYPLHLNFDIDASKNPISINGQGLTSAWQGLFKISGTYMNVETRGGLELLKGKFVFSGRKFDLTKGSVVFSGKPNELPALDIQAKITQQGVDIFANMNGLLDRPKISFSSSPPLPASSILSLLIFGQQLSELSVSQTIDLSASMQSRLDPSSLSKADSVSSLGINRFNIIKPSLTDPFATDQMAVQLGKYISRGIVVSFSQGEEQGSSNIIVEVDLKKGFIFQAESQQEQEQGKFSLKYQYNY